MDKSHDENRCSNCVKRKDEACAVDDFKGTMNCFAPSAQDGDLVCMNFEPEEGGGDE